VITDMGVLEPDPATRELVLTQLHPGVTLAEAQEATGWDLRSAPTLATTPPPTDQELLVLRVLEGTMAGAAQ
jgi:glutaconate CoA-transferase subunit B